MAETHPTSEHDPSILYLEHDAEITEAIEQLKGSPADTVRLVVPARSGLLQSVVNLKLLKKAATSSKKELVLVTSDKTAAALAGKLELPVAKNLKAAPHIVAGEPEPDSTPRIEADEPESASSADDSELPVARYDAPTSKRTKPAKTRSGGTGKVPNYQKFQKWIWIGASVLVLLLFGWLATAFLQTATIHIQAAADKQAVDTDFTLSATNNGSTTVIALPIEITKDLSQGYQASGKKDVGAKASGTVVIKNCEDTDSHALPAGSKLTTAGKTFLTSAATTIPGGDFSGGGTVCTSSTVSVAVVAEQNGDSYNFTGASFAVAGMSSNISATGTTSGGVTKNITVIAQADVDGAQKTAIETAQSAALTELRDKTPADQKLFEDTLATSVVSSSPNPGVGTEAGSGTLTLKVKFTALTAAKTDLEEMIRRALEDKIADGSEVLDAGLDQAEYTQTKAAGGQYTYNVVTTAFTGQPIDKAAVARQAAGKSKKAVQDLARQYPNVSGATVDAWALVPNMPLSADNIKVDIQVSK